MEWELELIGNFGAQLKADVMAELEKGAFPAFRAYALEVLEDAKQENPKQPFTIAVDGKLASEAGIGGATKLVQIHFAQQAVMIAVHEFARAFREISKQKQVRWDKMKKGGLRVNIPATVKVFWWKAAQKELVEITSVGEIDSFEPGDSITVTSSSPWQQYMNTMYQGGPDKAHPSPNKVRNKDGSGGFFGMVARRIRTRLRAGPSRNGRTALWVGAYRSRAILKKIGMPPLKTSEGIENWNKHVAWGAWGILIKYSSRVALTGLNMS